MYDISIPVINATFKRSGREKTVGYFKEVGAKRIFLALGRYETDEVKRKESMALLKENTEYLKAQGFEVGAWIWTFWITEKTDYVHMRFTSGESSEEFICPSDSRFRTFAAGYIEDIARAGVDIILYDDDFRYGFIGNGGGCICKNHIEYMENQLKEKLPDDFCEKYLLSGGGNKYRSAWLDANRHFLITFAKEMREALDRINPKTRFGVCSCISAWDMDGSTSIEISKALAGNTKPFLRLIGAPYWASANNAWGNRLQDTIELERMELSWCINEDIEIVSEGDPCPRPRYNCPSSYLEGFDTALRADAVADGILKYMLDYTSVTYETGYMKSHIRNKELYNKIDSAFSSKEAVGVRVYESMKKYENMLIPDGIDSNELQNIFFSPAARMLAANTIPTVYTGSGICSVAFGENAKYIPTEALSSGMIIDARAAQILCEKGIDVGIKTIGEQFIATEEYFPAENEYASISNIHFPAPATVYKTELNKNAIVQSYLFKDGVKFPSSYIYENASSQKFLVFTFDAYFAPLGLFRQYTRQRQLCEDIKWLSGKALPAHTSGNPDLYIMCKKQGDILSVGLWNFFADKVYEPQIELDGKYTKVISSNCDVLLKDNKAIIPGIEAFSFVFFEVSL